VTDAAPKPKPITTSFSQEFWEGMDRGELRIQRCHSCGALQGYAKPSCLACASTDLGWEAASGEATVYSWTRTEANPPTPFVPELPYTLVIAELAEGPRMLALLAGGDPGGQSGLECGEALRAIFVDRADGVRLPTFVTVRP
jgi:uncharacterized OB-fold protein